jgi:uncharacterized protein YkwD
MTLLKSLAGCLLAGWLLAPVPVQAQKSRENTRQSPAPAAREVPASSPFAARVEKEIVRLTNQFRKQKGREELTVNSDLTQAARSFARYLARKDRFSHTADGKEPWERARAFGYQYCIVAENIAYRYRKSGYASGRLAAAFLDGWKKSPGHRRNLLDRDVTEIGVGVAKSKRTGRYYAVQNFGRPASKAITFLLTNRTGSRVDYRVDGKAESVAPGYTITHRRCRPPDLTIKGAGGNSSQGNQGKVLHPRDGDRYVIRKERGGGYTVEKQ